MDRKPFLELETGVNLGEHVMYNLEVFIVHLLGPGLAGI